MPQPTPVSPTFDKIRARLDEAFLTTNRRKMSAVVPALVSLQNRSRIDLRLSTAEQGMNSLAGNRKVYFRHIGNDCSQVLLKDIGCDTPVVANSNKAKEFEVDLGERKAFVLTDASGVEKVMKFKVNESAADFMPADFIPVLREHLIQLSEGTSDAFAAELLSMVGKTIDGGASYNVSLYNSPTGATTPTVTNPMARVDLDVIADKELAKTGYMLFGGSELMRWAGAAGLNILNTVNYNDLVGWNGQDVVTDQVFNRLLAGQRRFVFYPQGAAQIIQVPYDVTVQDQTDAMARNLSLALANNRKLVFVQRLPNGLDAEVTVFRETTLNCDEIIVAARVYATLIVVPNGLTCGGDANNNGIVYIDDCTDAPSACPTRYSASRAVTKTSMAAFPDANIVKSPFGSNATITIPGVLTVARSIGDVIALLNADPNKPAGSSASINADMTTVTYADAAASITFTANIVIEAD